MRLCTSFTCLQTLCLRTTGVYDCLTVIYPSVLLSIMGTHTHTNAYMNIHLHEHTRAHLSLPRFLKRAQLKTKHLATKGSPSVKRHVSINPRLLLPSFLMIFCLTDCLLSSSFPPPSLSLSVSCACQITKFSPMYSISIFNTINKNKNFVKKLKLIQSYLMLISCRIKIFKTSKGKCN